MKELRRFRVVAYAFFGILFAGLTACGGGGGTSDPGFIGGGGDDPGDGGDPGPAPTFELAVALTDPMGDPTDRVSANSPGTLTVTVTSGGSAVAGEAVSVSTTLTAVDPSAGSQLSDENGVAVFQLLASGNAGLDQAIVSVADVSETVSFTVDAELSIVLSDQSGNPVTQISEETPGVITVTSSDSLGNPIQGDLVEASTTIGVLSPGSRLTDENGRAIFSLEAGGAFGAGSVSATSGNRIASLNFEIISLVGETNRVELTLTDTQGNPVTNITNINPGLLTVVATDETGLPLANQIVSAETTIGVLSPDSGTALTDLNGVATFTLSSEGTLGAGTASVQLGAATDSVNFQIGEANLRVGRFDGATFVPGEIEAGSTSLPAAGSTPLSVSVVDDAGQLISTTVEVLFNSGCANLSPPLAEISNAVNTVNGVATSTYTAAGCTGTDNITAAIGQGSGQTATVDLTIATADINSIAFVSATPTSLALKGTGGEGRSESSRVAFQVIDNTGSPVAGVDVSFELSTTIGGLSLTNPSATTDENGIAEAIVLAGNVATPVRVTATIDVNGTLLTTVSDRLVISTGLPDQDSVSLSSSILNPGGGNIDGVSATLTLRMADKFNNPVPIGTTAFFTTELGSIDATCQVEGTDGACSVNWRSQEPRLPLIYNSTEGVDAFVSTINNRVCPDTGLTGFPCVSPLGHIFGLRTQISAIVVGEESFVDVNGNGLYDIGEQFDDLPEAWLDKNENGQFDNAPPLCTIDSTTDIGRQCAQGQEEIFFDYDEDGVYDQGNGIYNGTLCPQELEASGDCSRELVHVRQDIPLVVSGLQDFALFDFFTNTPVNGITLPPGAGAVVLRVVVSDLFNNLPTAGATLSVSGDGCEVRGDGTTVPNTNSKGAFSYSFAVVADPENNEPVNGSVTVTLDGSVGTDARSIIYSCFDPAL